MTLIGNVITIGCQSCVKPVVSVFLHSVKDLAHQKCDLIANFYCTNNTNLYRIVIADNPVSGGSMIPVNSMEMSYHTSVNNISQMTKNTSIS